ncbi:MAG: hypothetical protein KDC54_14890 [Lewinella sp.]|nr:hypothetical protein [Lewinella sp.]
MQKRLLLLCTTLLLGLLSGPAWSQGGSGDDQQNLLINLDLAGSPINNAVDIQQIGSTNSSEVIQRGNQEVQLYQIGDGNYGRIRLASDDTQVNVLQQGDQNSFNLAVEAGANNQFAAFQFNDQNNINLEFNQAINIDLTIIQDGGRNVNIQMEDASAPMPSNIIIQGPMPDINIRSDNFQPIGIFNQN